MYQTMKNRMFSIVPDWREFEPGTWFTDKEGWRYVRTADGVESVDDEFHGTEIAVSEISDYTSYYAPYMMEVKGKS